jgi:hypothetical protein
MSTEISLEYGDVLKAYQTKVTELITQLITAEAKLNASAVLINKLVEKNSELESENLKLQKASVKTTKKSSASIDNVVDYN